MSTGTQAPDEEEVWMATPGDQADAMFVALRQTLRDLNKAQCDAGKMPAISDPVTALVGLLGLVVGGIEDERVRMAVYRGCGVMLTIAINNARESGSSDEIQIMQRGTGTMQ